VRTSYFARLKDIDNPVSISGKAPDWYTGPEYKVLAPKYEFFMAYKRGEIDQYGYTQAFNSLVLGQLDPHEVFTDICCRWGFNTTLLCYEKPGDFCHRRLVAQWFEKELGFEVPELGLRQIR
jgi:hypothetical protein